MKKVDRGIRSCAPVLARSAQAATGVAEAIMTSDTRRKEIAVELKLGKQTVRIGGLCKGAGMIQPLMSPNGRTNQLHATMLALITSDAAITSGLLKQALAEAVTQSFNRITVDGDMSTNDSVIVLANGLAGNARIEKRNSTFRAFCAALTFVCLELAKMIVRDGEGVSRFVTIRVCGARSAVDAERAARAVANSSLVRTSWCGGDPNWGRILCALGYSGARVNESVVDIGYSRDGRRGIVYGFRRGRPGRASWKALTGITSKPEFEIHIDLHLGNEEFVLYASDLTEDYVSFNKGDITDPGSLGG
jgi:glutamate N-acetyltransferase/amino-acid N-acetyltransferase